MLVHHDGRDYETAKGHMADHIRKRFEQTIEQGRLQAQTVLEQIDREIPRDDIIGGSQVEFVPVGDGVELLIKNEELGVHDHAFRQICDRGKMNLTFAKALADIGRAENGDAKWARDLLAHNLNTLYHDGPGKEARYLFRAIDGGGNDCAEIRGWLSDTYRRLDCRPLLQAFHALAIQEAGMVPVRGYALPTKVAIRCVLPTVFEPIHNEPMLYGFEWYNSDFGHGAHSLRAFLHRPWCTNEATRDDVLRQWHHGKKLSDDFKYSTETYELDQKTSVAALRDVVKGLLEPASVDATFGVITKAHEEKIDPKRVPAMLRSALTKSESKKVIESFESRDNDNLPEGNTRWRLANSISFLATNTDNQYRAMQLERVAGRVSGLAKSRGSDED